MYCIQKRKVIELINHRRKSISIMLMCTSKGSRDTMTGYININNNHQTSSNILIIANVFVTQNDVSMHNL